MTFLLTAGTYDNLLFRVKLERFCPEQHALGKFWYRDIFSETIHFLCLILVREQGIFGEWLAFPSFCYMLASLVNALFGELMGSYLEAQLLKSRLQREKGSVALFSHTL